MGDPELVGDLLGGSLPPRGVVQLGAGQILRGLLAGLGQVIAGVAEQVEDSSIDAVIKTASIDTGDENRDGHLRTADFFDVENNPEITFHSTSIQLGGGEGTITGELTINGVTRTVELDTEFNGVVVDAFETTRAGFEATTTISRKDFGLTWNAAIEAGGVLVSDKVVLNLDVAFTAPQA